MRRIAMTFVVAGLILAAARDASAQKPWEDRVYMNIGFGVESGDSTLTDARPLTIYEETGSVSTTSTFTSGSLFDVGVGSGCGRTSRSAFRTTRNKTTPMR